ncbi:early nodulin-like protein 3 [Heracleum sosnowskyi]|uniref:Early nodulin-like protein 3 n=1 Tax=Heracleum sosnowskyi TaxID=360622 RepID=A0AAD8N118_9APIA|nr:early nodulin-like protein 3 [Heracleum sosnowskyi]
MAIPTLTRIHESKASYAFELLSLFLLIQNACAFEFIVGGSNGWAPSGSNALNQWAESKRFQIDDSLVFNYAADQDSVLYVTKDDYTNCNTAYPIMKFTDGHSVYKFNQSGPHYFISGNEEHCHKNEKLVVVVLADRRNKYSNSPPPLESNPSPPPTDSYSPPPAESYSPPTDSNSPPPVESIPSPPPTSEQTPSDMNPTSPHKNSAAALSSIITFLSSIGVLLGSSLMLVL